MRQERIIQATIFEVLAEHEIGRELKAISQWLDEHRALLGLVVSDLRRHGIAGFGDGGPRNSQRSRDLAASAPRRQPSICRADLRQSPAGRRAPRPTLVERSDSRRGGDRPRERVMTAR